MNQWWKTFFDADYVRLWEGAEAFGNVERQVEGLWSLLALNTGCTVLDAPCGFGRFSVALAQRGARVLGADLSVDALAAAEGRRGDLSTEQLRYEQHDLRTPLAETGFDVALNLFSSLGYGSEADDLAAVRRPDRGSQPRLMRRLHDPGRRVHSGQTQKETES